jgi:ribosomal protein L33
MALLLSGFLGSAVVGLTPSGPVISRPAFAGDSAKCTIATSGKSMPAKACARGGRAEAAKTMKKMVAEAKDKGQKLNCESCHKDQETFTLTKNAREDLKRLEALVAKDKK